MRWPAQHISILAEPHEIGEVGVALAELSDTHLALGARQVLAQIGLNARGVELFLDAYFLNLEIGEIDVAHGLHPERDGGRSSLDFS